MDQGTLGSRYGFFNSSFRVHALQDIVPHGVILCFAFLDRKLKAIFVYLSVFDQSPVPLSVDDGKVPTFW